MQAAGQFGDVPQYVGSRVGASHGHMFTLSHEMSLSSSATPAQAHAHGHGLSLSHPSPHSQASQSHIQSQIASASTQPSFLQTHQQQQQQQQQQHVQHGFNVSMGGAPPKASPAPSPTSHPQVQAPQPTQALQSASQQLKADIKQHQQHQLHHVQQTEAHDHGAHQQAASGDSIQLIKPKEQPVEARGSVAGADIAPSTQGGTVHKGGGAVREDTSGDGEEVDEEGERGSGGNRWPRQEALALLKIRSEMDAAFRDSSLKGPLWEEISRKLAEMGYHRSAKKCKEKFENVHKYYKRTKEGKTGRQDGKSYRFFTQLEALYGKAGESTAPLINLNNSKSPVPHASSPVSNNHTVQTGGLLISLNGDHPSPAAGLITAANHNTLNLGTSNVSGPVPLASFPPFKPAYAASAAAAAATNAHIARTLEKVESMKREPENNTTLQYFLDSSDENDDDDDDDEDDDDDDDNEFDEPAARESTMPTTQNPPRGKKRKRKSMKKYLVFFEKVMKKVLDKQEHMQQKFLEALERRDQDRMIREEAWKRQEMARLNREHDVRAAERALSASRDASLVAFLQKMTGQSITLPHLSSTAPLQTTNNHQYSTAIVPAEYMQNESNADRDAYDPCSKRWPKPEVLALIKLRTSLDQRFHEPGSKAVLWEEISAGMTSQGYARTAKRCKEKWENINKYFKKAKESNKKRPENAKTCPYFHHLNALYKEGLLGGGGGGAGGGGGGSSISSKHLMVTEKGEEQSDDVMDDQGGNTSKYNGEESGQAQEGDSAPTLRAGNEIQASGFANLVQPANASAIIASTSVGIMTPPSVTLRASSTSSETKMHMFMGSERGDVKDHASVIKNGLSSSDHNVQPQPAIDLSSATVLNVNQPAQASPATTIALPFNLEQAISSSRSLPLAPAVKQSEQSQT